MIKISAEKSDDNSAWRAFWQAATRPSLPALSIALAVALAAVIGALIGLESAGLGGYRLLMENDRDDYCYFTGKVGEIGESRDTPTVVWMGGSSARESVSSEQEFSDLVHAATGYRPDVHFITPDGMTHWEFAAAVEQFVNEFNGVILLNVSPFQLAKNTDNLAKLLTN